MKNLKNTLVISTLALTVNLTAQAETYEIIVKHKPNNSGTTTMSKRVSLNKVAMTQEFSKISTPISAISHRTTGKSNYSIVTVEANSAESAKAMLEESNRFANVEIVPQTSIPMPVNKPLYLVSTNGSNKNIPTDNYYTDQRGYMGALRAGYNLEHQQLSGHNFEAVWENTPETTRKVRVGVADSGFLPHVDISFADESADFVDNDANAFETRDQFDGTENNCSPHGNGVASGIAAIHDGEIGMVGGATNVEIVAARVMNCGRGGIQFADAIRWYAGQSFAERGIPDISAPVDVINLSLGGQSNYCMSYVQESIEYATERGIPVVIAAGNMDIPVEEFLPANCEGTFITGATKWSHEKAGFSNYGDSLTVSAQGVDILGYGYQNESDLGYAMWWEGTSNAAPQVAAAIANVKSQVDGLTINAIKFLLKATSNNFAEDSKCSLEGDICGAGSLNAYNFTEAAKRFSINELGYIRHSLADNTECDAKIFIEQLGEAVAVCEMYTVSFNEFAAEKSNLTYKGYRVAKGGNLSLTNSEIELFIDSENRPHFNMVLTPEELISYHYGYVMCTGDECSETILPMTVDATKNTSCP